MRFHDFKLFVRNLLRNRLYSTITVGGFAVSLTFVILLGMYIRQELLVDEFHTKKERIFRMAGEDGAIWGALVGEKLKNVFPEIEEYTRFYENYNSYGERNDGKKLSVHMLYADTSFWKMFDFPLQEGRPFRTRKELVISVSFARKMFGEESPLGKDLKLGGETGWIVVGIMTDFPSDTHFNRGEVIADFNNLSPDWISNDNSASFGLYLLEKPGSDLTAKLPEMHAQLKKDFWMYRDNYRKELFLEPLTSVYWSDRWAFGTHHNSPAFITVMIAIVGVILLLAFINYTNLSVARAGFRAKESAVKKLLGSNNASLFRQYITESVLLCFAAFAIACCLCMLIQPWFNDILHTHLVLSEHLTLAVLGGTLLAVAGTGILAGLTPAWIITRFNPVEVMKGAFRKKSRNIYGKVLISFQYFVAITLILCTLVLWKQTDYMRTYDLGFDKNNVVWLQSKLSGKQNEPLRNELMRIPGVEGVSFAYGTPLDGGTNNTMTDYAGTGKMISFQRFEVDSAFFPMLRLQVQPTGAAYDAKGVWLNEAGAKAIGNEPLPREINWYGKNLPVLGIIKDFHYLNLTREIGPLVVFNLDPELGFSKILVKIAAENPGIVFDKIKASYSGFIDGLPFASGFMDRTINAWYENDARTTRLIGYFSVLAIILSMMGILAMATYFIRQRVKEIGIRRVNGATIGEILTLLISNFMKWVALAFCLACPVGGYIMHRWLEAFPYRTEISWWLFISAGSAAFIAAASMVIWQSSRAATENPVKALRTE